MESPAGHGVFYFSDLSIQIHSNIFSTGGISFEAIKLPGLTGQQQ